MVIQFYYDCQFVNEIREKFCEIQTETNYKIFGSRFAKHIF